MQQNNSNYQIWYIPNMKILSLLLSLAFFSEAQATKLASVDITKLYKEADAVVLVEIEQGKLLNMSSEECGAKYSGKIKESLKGKFKKKSIIDFSTYSRVSLGDTFLIFIARSDNQVKHLASTNTFSQRIEKQRQFTCSKYLPKYHVIHNGTAMLKTYYAPIPNSKPSFVVYGPIQIPKTMKSYFISKNNLPEKCKIYSTCIRVEKESMYKVLKKIH
jgi:ribosomal silencing factor RsfS